jgi:hypothetical protein
VTPRLWHPVVLVRYNAVRRTTFWDPLIDLRARKTTREAAVAEIGLPFRNWVEIFENARTVGKG